MSARAQMLLDLPLGGIVACSLDEANAFLIEVQHGLGPVTRPFRSEAFKLVHGSETIAVAVSSAVSATVAGYRRTEVVELARLAASNRWANRVMLRLWREWCGPLYAGWKPRAAISYSKNATHSGDLYRFDGWKKIRDDCGSSGGGAWSRRRYATDAVHGPKTLWLWSYEAAA